jgi:tetratricopeptide (TPR) repeat protein
MQPSRPVNKSVQRLWRVIAFLGLFSLAAQAGEDITSGVTLFERRQFAAARQFFEEFVSQHPTDPSGMYYLGRLAFESEQYTQATTWFEKALQLDEGNSEYHRWLGRVYGRQAQHAGGEAFFLARKVKTHLEKAVELNPDNIEARFDLMEYYLQAPAFLGGDIAKAKAQATEIAKRNAAAGKKAWQRCLQEDVSAPAKKATVLRRDHTRTSQERRGGG